ncbi:MAG: hypothetical protein ACQER9_04670 [Nanobdellota archaeon]
MDEKKKTGAKMTCAEQLFEMIRLFVCCRVPYFHTINRGGLKVLSMLLFFCLLQQPVFCRAELKEMNDKELAAVTGKGPVDFSIIGNTARYYFDIHSEVYAEIDSIKLGYYNKEDLTTRKYLAPDDPDVHDNGDGTFNVTDPITGQTVYENAPYFEYEDGDGEMHHIPYTDNDYYQYKYKPLLGSLVDFYVDGRQGDNDALFDFSKAPSRNENHLDWDINWENVRLGENEENPLVVDGLVVMLKYDDISSPNKRLTDIIVGTNSMEGAFNADMKRSTGYFNSKLPNEIRSDNILLGSLVPEFNEAPVPVSLQRDSFLYIIDSYMAQYDDPDDGNTPPHPEDPTNNNIHTGAFLRIGLDPSSPHFGYSMIAGYNEIVANAYQPTQAPGQHLKDAVRDWWDK